MTTIRQSPSGPNLANAQNGLLDLGPSLYQARWIRRLTASSIQLRSAGQLGTAIFEVVELF